MSPDTPFTPKLKLLKDIATELNLSEDELIPYGRVKAKIALSVLERLKTRPLGRYILVTAINLLAACLDNHLFHGNALNVDPERISWPRVLALNDRALRKVTLESGRQTEFVITEASEVMAILALATSMKDLRQRLGRIFVGMTKDDHPVVAEELGCAGAMAALLKDALCPNLLQTVEGTPAIIHAGPFGNIAHGNCSILADAMALRLTDYVVTEAGFGSEL